MAINVDDLLNTNSPPSQVQRNHLQNVIFRLGEDISGINEQILAMQAKILVLQTRRTQLDQQRRCYSSLLSPVRCLPIEIFGQIFVYATCDRPKHVLNLSAVCQLWRYAALSTPMLWSTLKLGRHVSRRNIDNHIDSWIERARSYPLSLVIIDRYSFVDPVNIALPLITNHQLKSITLVSDDELERISSILGKLEFSNLEMLESLSLETRFCSKFTPPDALRYAPKLKTLNLNTLYHGKFETLPFPWRQLTSLTITSWGNPDIGVDILQACVNLEEFILDGYGPCEASYGDRSGPNDSITLNYLRKLHLQCNGRIFPLSLKTPSIQDFTINSKSGYFLNLDFYDYIEKNGSTLLKLSIAPVHSRLIESIPYFRSLVELKLYDDNCNDEPMIFDILDSLVVELEPEMDLSTILLPRLEALEIVCHATERYQRMFMKVINSRWWSDEEENARQKQGRRSLSRIKRSVLMNVHSELNMFFSGDVDVLRTQGMSIEYLASYDGMDGEPY